MNKIILFFYEKTSTNLSGCSFFLKNDKKRKPPKGGFHKIKPV